MTELRQRFYLHSRRSKGGFTYVHQILDGEKVIGWKSEGCEARGSAIKTTYSLVGSDQFFSTAKELIAAYEAQKSKAA